MSGFTYNPDDANPILADGDYEAVIIGAKTGETKKGDQKLEVTVRAYGPDNKTPLITDNIVAPFGIRRLKQLCAATGVSFDSGEVAPQAFVGENVRVRTRIRHDDAGQYDDQNTIKAYLVDDGDRPKPAPQRRDDRSPGDGGSPSNAPPSAQTEPPPESEASDAAIPASIGRSEAFDGYRDAARREYPNVEQEIVATKFEEACRAIGKPEADFAEADWIKVRDEAPKDFLPF